MMDINEFVQNFAKLFDDTDTSVFTPETKFRDHKMWSSLIALSVMMMVDYEYDVQLIDEEMRKVNTIRELFVVVSSHK